MSVSGERMLAGMLDACRGMSMEQLPEAVREHAARAGLSNVLVYVSDLQEDVLRLLSGRGPGAGQGGEQDPDELSIADTAAGRSFETLRPQFEAGAGAGRWWVPMLDGAERVGAPRVDTEGHEGGERAVMRQLATLVTILIMTKRAHSDSYARRVRTQRMNVAAEMQWNLMPPRAFANAQVTISAALEPAYEIGGDAFDYALADETVHVGVFDAMGHDVAAGLTANLAVATRRNSRRQGAGLVETGRTIEKVLVEQLRQTRYVTAILADLDIRSGEPSRISHGHHSPVLVREDHWNGLLPCPPGAPLGTDLGPEATLCHEQLRPGDRPVFYTDGVTETRNPDGEEFGLDRFTNFVIHHNADGMPVPETLRRLVRSILDYQQGRLQDDATVLFLEWRGPDTATHGTDVSAELRSRPEEDRTLPRPRA
ncbi:hypothetical protein SUDANB176_00974 [Streptomyces sp. enrichment culture]|uniref:PP2C family protein-serine/threonine phosphatase n=1 Tax=Streptomyces sp. enrichment culture TaxID=1795815 RepID=UPI003F547CFD